MEKQLRHGVVDRIEEGRAVICTENGETLTVPAGTLGEGDAVLITGKRIVCDREETDRRKKRANALEKGVVRR